MNHGNFQFIGGIPYVHGDRQYAQDYIRDFRYLQWQMGEYFYSITGKTNAVLTGCICTGTGTLTITSGTAVVKTSIAIPDNSGSWTLPTATTTADANMFIKFPGDTVDISGCSVGPTYYIKLAYDEATVQTRTKTHVAASYAFELAPSYTLTVTTVLPTAYEVEIARFIMNAPSDPIFFTIPCLNNSGNSVQVINFDNNQNPTTIRANVKQLVLRIYDWDMDTDGTYNITHELPDHTKIIDMQCWIFSDGATDSKQLTIAPFSTNLPQGFIYFDSTTIYLARLGGGDFDSVNYNASGFRGHVVISYYE